MSLTTYKSRGLSGKKTATEFYDTVVVPGEGEVNGHLFVQVLGDEANGVEVAFIGMTDGIVVANGETASFLCDDISKVQIRRNGGTNAEYRYWAF